MAQPVEILLRDEDIQAIITGLATNQATMEAVANRLQATQPLLTNRQDNETFSSGRRVINMFGSFSLLGMGITSCMLWHLLAVPYPFPPWAECKGYNSISTPSYSYRILPRVVDITG